MAQELGDQANAAAPQSLLDFETQQIGQIGQSSQAAAEAMIQGALDYKTDLARALPAAKRALYGQAAAGLAAGAGQSGRGGACAYGGAITGGLQAGQQAAGFDLTASQKMADAAQMQSQGLATQAAAADAMLKYGTAESRLAKAQLDAEQLIQQAISTSNNKKDYNKKMAALYEIYKNNPQMLQYVQLRANQIGDPYAEQGYIEQVKRALS